MILTDEHLRSRGGNYAIFVKFAPGPLGSLPLRTLREILRKFTLQVWQLLYNLSLCCFLIGDLDITKKV